VLPTLRNSCDRQSDVAFLLNTLGQLWLAGVQINWQCFYADERRHRVPLPTYPFERQRYWIEPQKQVLTSWEKGTEQQQEISKTVESKIQNFARPNLRNSYMAPSNEIERTIADIYQELLGIGQVGIHDNFFEMGGNSLIGIQLLSQIRKLFQIELPLRYLFAAPTVAEFALAIEEAIVAELEELTEEEAKKLVLVGER
jgi:acyl carrier protein